MKGQGRGGPRAGAGRPKGVPNKVSGELKDDVIKTFRKVGGVKYLEQLARTHPGIFCRLLGKLLPTELATAEGPLKHEVVLRWMTPEMAKARGFAPKNPETTGQG